MHVYGRTVWVFFLNCEIHTFLPTGGIYWQLCLDAGISMTEAEIRLNEADRDCLIKGRISMVSPGPVPRCHGIGGHYWKRGGGETQKDRREDGIIFPCTSSFTDYLALKL